MQGLFRANGSSGYLKKPDILLEVGPHNEAFDPSRSLPVLSTLKVVSNDLLLYPVLYIYISFTLAKFKSMDFRLKHTWEKVGIWISTVLTSIVILLQTSF